MPYSDSTLAGYRELSTRLLTIRDEGPQPFTFDLRAAGRAARFNVHAVGIGQKIVEGRTTDVECIQIYVTQKLPDALLTGDARIPSEISGIPTDIVESPMAVATVGAVAAPCTDHRRTMVRPLVAGVSTGHPDVSAGTIAAFCRSLHRGDNPEDNFVLSNNHVFANLGQAQPGDALLQPGRSDGGSEPDSIFAQFTRAEPIIPGPKASNKVDASIGRVIPGMEFSNQICSIGLVVGTTQAVKGMPIRKHGRSTGLTHGFVVNELVDALVGLNPARPNEVTRFIGQMRIEPSSKSVFIGGNGDSGSLIVTSNPALAVGLLFAAPPDGSFGFANQIADVLGLLDIELLIA